LYVFKATLTVVQHLICDAEEATVVAVETLRLAPNKRSFSDHQPSGHSFLFTSVFV